MTESLREYHRKRDFAKTVEPAGGETRPSPQPIFVIQRHDASTLHYDFRLEVDGVLKSWAVPKGPPEETGARRLAVPTEDHPLEYATFEGRIAKGQYGAGEVEIWDHGVFRNLRADNAGEPATMAESIVQGKIEVLLEGQRLRGPYALVRTQTNDEEQWLLLRMKERQSA